MNFRLLNHRIRTDENKMEPCPKMRFSNILVPIVTAKNRPPGGPLKVRTDRGQKTVLGKNLKNVAGCLKIVRCYIILTAMDFYFGLQRMHRGGLVLFLERIMDFVAIDFETATPERSSACAVGLVDVRNGEIIERHFSLIRPPENAYSRHNIQVHGITPEMTENSKDFGDIWPWIAGILDGRIIVSHNKNFDSGVLEACTATTGTGNMVIKDFLCSCDIARICLPELTDHKLKTLASYFDIEFEHHNALSDAETGAKVLIRLLRHTGKTVSFLSENYYVHPTYFEPISSAAFGSDTRYQARSRDNYSNFVNVLAVRESQVSLLDINEIECDGRLTETVFIFTGELRNLSRDDAENAVQMLGGTIPSSNVTKKTTHVVIGPEEETAEKKTGKHRKALEYVEKGQQIQILTESEFLELIGLIPK